MHGWKLALRSLLAAAVAAFLLLSPPYLDRALSENPYHSLFEKEQEPWTGILTLWHVVGFKTYQGSISAYLENCAAGYERAHPGVYVEVLGMDAAGMRVRLERGETPDIWSFPCGALYPEQLAPLAMESLPAFAGTLRPAQQEGVPYALPLLYSGYLLLGNPLRVQDAGLSWPSGPEEITAQYLQAALDATPGKRAQLCTEPLLAAHLGLSGTPAQEGDFAAGQVALRLGDLRAAGDLSRKQASDPKAISFDAMPLPGGFTDRVQYLGIAAGIAAHKAAHANALITLLLEPRAQGKIAALGAMPAVAEALQSAAYEEGLLQAAASAYAAPIAPDPFLWQRNRDALAEEALRALGGDAQAKAAFDARLGECMGQ